MVKFILMLAFWKYIYQILISVRFIFCAKLGETLRRSVLFPLFWWQSEAVIRETTDNTMA